jgi:RNA polymerase sigma-70 factor (ECF subfamily)
MPSSDSREVQLSQVESDRQLVERCLSRDPAAWSQLYQQFHDRLLASIRPVLGAMAQDLSLIDEIGARVWYALVRNDFELLARFDVARGCQLSTFLGIIAKREAKQLLRSERRRRGRELSASRPDRCQDQTSRGLDPAAEQEFLDILTPSERMFYADVLVAVPGSVPAKGYSQSNAWQLTHRVREKLTSYLSSSTVNLGDSNANK